MRHCLPFASTLIVATLLLSGCTLLPDREPPPPLVTSGEFQARLDQLEGAVTSSCVTAQQGRLDQQLQQQQALSADVREVGSLLRQLRGEVARLDRDDDVPQVASQCSDSPTRLDNKEILGRTEWIGLPGVGTYLKARIDSGATTSSLSATEITRFERDGENWVRFKLGLNEADSVVDSVRDEWIEAPVERRVRIIQASGEDSRPVISLLMTLGPLRETVQFTLNDRTHLDHPVLLGRRFLMDIAIIDVAEQYLHDRPEFPGGRPAEEAGTDEAADRDEDEAETEE
ncbi:ATP-dependent zinc protease [Halomonas rhizosphaerae]|uniref:ATP-dependent zinc protease n=1 Tax=Halomonas rhizosphaerae TaxID=3043296 RepID=A0ABT6V1D4_9GAMM|nr:ATP-dependent zinc protease [Halomonas rhizosphaerae]MDI5892011.1 ATP-dependent zinc protease [Halomonas rhizosphaerae]MDI5920549.1 ATP-dependent zinc protease [Halomonas rhizosphaerae]